MFINYNNNINDLIKTRYTYKGNLKIPVDIIHSLSDKEKNQINRVFDTFKENALNYFIIDKKTCVSYPLSPSRTLYIDYTNNHLNFYIKDIKNKEITQLLSINDINKIIRSERLIYKAIQNTVGKDIRQNAHDNIFSTLVQSAYNSKINNRGSPTVEGYKLNDDIDLDI